MPAEPELADRVRAALPSLGLKDGETLAESRMFGGLCFTLNGKMLAGVDKQGRLVVRIGTDDYERELARGRVEPMDLTGKPLKGFAFVPEPSIPDEAALLGYIEGSAAYVREFMLSRPRK